MVLGRSQYENMSKEELIEELISHDDIAAKLSELTKRFDEFSDKYKVLHSELKITQDYNSLLLERVYQPEPNAVSNSQYPLKKCWNFKAVFKRNSGGIAEVNIWNHSGILTEFHGNTIGILPPMLSKFTACFPELFR